MQPESQDISPVSVSSGNKGLVSSNAKVKKFSMTSPKMAPRDHEDSTSQVLCCDSSPRPCIPLALFGNKNRRKKHLRRAAYEIDRSFICPYEDCGKYFGSEGSQNLHIKIKHNGGTKTEREKLAQKLIEAYAEAANKLDAKDPNVVIDQAIIDQVELNLPPGIITQTARKSGLLSMERLAQFNEVALLQTINQRLAPKFRQMICKEQERIQNQQQNKMTADQNLD